MIHDGGSSSGGWKTPLDILENIPAEYTSRHGFTKTLAYDKYIKGDTLTVVKINRKSIACESTQKVIKSKGKFPHQTYVLRPCRFRFPFSENKNKTLQLIS